MAAENRTDPLRCCAAAGTPTVIIGTNRPDRLVQHVRCRSPEEALLGGVWLPVTVAAAAERGSIVFRNINDTRCPG